MLELVLASASPRRKDLLEQLGLKFKIIASNLDEKTTEKISAWMLAEKLALQKAEEIARSLNAGYLIIGADTVVCINRSILGKPENERDAFNMLKRLSGKTHKVITGVAIIESPNKRAMVFHEETKVRFRHLEDDEIIEYIKTGEPMDKAGAYGVQGVGSIFVKEIRGCYNNVVGLPISKLSEALKEFGIEILSSNAST